MQTYKLQRSDYLTLLTLAGNYWGSEPYAVHLAPSQVEPAARAAQWRAILRAREERRG